MNGLHSKGDFAVVQDIFPLRQSARRSTSSSVGSSVMGQDYHT
jgi:hypothetical protein